LLYDLGFDLNTRDRIAQAAGDRDLRDRTAMFAGGKVFAEPLGEHSIRAEGSERNQPIQIALFPEAATARSLRGADRSPSSCLLE
jgi:hypothetical protein